VAGGAVLSTGSGGADVSSLPVQYQRSSHASLVLYLVGSQEQAKLVEAGEAARERAWAGAADADAQVVVLTVTTLEDEQTAQDLVYSWAASEPDSIRVFDLR
jgi:hypothetical protein